MSRVTKMVYLACSIAAIGIAAFAIGVYVVNNVEHPKYTTVVADGDIEIRQYPRLIVAEVTRSGDRSTAVNSGFSPLAGYIFAKERSGDRIAMTAPVTQEPRTIAMTAPVTQSMASDRPEAAEWRVRFIMPAQYDLEKLPRPAGSDVELKSIPPARRAAIRFSGVATDEVIAKQEARLRAWLKSRGLMAKGPGTYAYYNAPFTPGFLRRNEVWLDLPEAGTIQ